jgi:hypothetical protein
MSGRHLSEKLVPTFTGIRGVMWSVQRVPTAVNRGFIA